MSAVFADTSFYLALLDEGDALHERALTEAKVERPILTTEFIILELGNACARAEDHADFLALLEGIRASRRTTILPLDCAVLQRGLNLFASRPDKHWSLTDCTSFTVMGEQEVFDALSSDHHSKRDKPSSICGKMDCGMPRRNRSGLTLVELLVVIAIISVLAALLFPALNAAKSRARRVHCLSNQHQLGIALNTFLTDNHTYPLWAAPTNNEPPGHWWAEQLQRAALHANGVGPNFMQQGVWRCPSSARPRPESVSYGYNAFGSLSIGNATNNLGLLGHYTESSESLTPIRETEVVNSAGMIAIGESDVVTFMRAANYDLAGGRPRHQGKLNLLFCDGHVQGFKPATLFEETSDVALAIWNRDHMAHRDKL